MYICDLYFQDPEIGSLVIFVIYVFIEIIVIVISQHSEPVYWSCAEDIGCLITFVKLQVFRVSSG